MLIFDFSKSGKFNLFSSYCISFLSQQQHLRFIETVKPLEKKNKGRDSWYCLDNNFLDITHIHTHSLSLTHTHTHKPWAKPDRWNYIKLKISLKQRKQTTEWKSKQWSGIKYLWTKYLITYKFSKYLSNSIAITTKRKIIQFQNGHCIWRDFSSKKIDKWPSLWKAVQHHYQRNANQNYKCIISQDSEWWSLF
jgi:hypothetical protein